MTSPDSPSPRTEAEAPSTREAWALHVATFRAFGDDPGTHALGYARCQQLGRELALLGYEVRLVRGASTPAEPPVEWSDADQLAIEMRRDEGGYA